MNQTMTGFTLIELLITLSLIAVLALSAVSINRGPAIKMNQDAAKLDLLNFADALESYRDMNGTYLGADLTKLYRPISKHYHFSVIASDTHQYLIAAAPKQTDKEDKCGSFFLDQNGHETVSGSDQASECW